MVMVTRAKGRRLDEEEPLDCISRLPDAVLGDIVSLLPTRDGARTQAISSRWRHLWRTAPLNIDLQDNSIDQRTPFGEISGILSSHPGPARRFSVPMRYFELNGHPVATLDSWLRSPALDHLQELEFHHDPWGSPTPPLPASVHRFSSTLRVASFGGCRFPDGDNASALRLPLLKRLSLLDVRITENSLHALLDACPALQSLLLSDDNGCSRVRIVSPCLRSIGVCPGLGGISLEQLIIEDTPFLERLLLSGSVLNKEMVISVISAPKLDVLGQLGFDRPRLEFGTTVFQGSQIVSLMTVVCSVKVLAFTQTHLSLDMVINFMKCFPCLKNLYIKTILEGEKNVWCHKSGNIIGPLDICLKKIVLANYQGNESHVNFAKFFVLNARVLESMTLELQVGNPKSAWIERQHRLLQIKNKASRDARFDFVSQNSWPLSHRPVYAEQVHDLSTADPFVRFHYWT